MSAANSNALVVLPQRARLGCSPDSALTQRIGLVGKRFWSRLDYLEATRWLAVNTGWRQGTGALALSPRDEEGNHELWHTDGDVQPTASYHSMLASLTDWVMRELRKRR